MFFKFNDNDYFKDSLLIKDVIFTEINHVYLANPIQLSTKYERTLCLFIHIE